MIFSEYSSLFRIFAFLRNSIFPNFTTNFSTFFIKLTIFSFSEVAIPVGTQNPQTLDSSSPDIHQEEVEYFNTGEGEHAATGVDYDEEVNNKKETAGETSTIGYPPTVRLKLVTRPPGAKVIRPLGRKSGGDIDLEAIGRP